MSSEIPEARLATEPTVDEDIESADSKKCRIALTAREDVEGWMTKSNIAHNITRLEEMIERHRWQRIRDVTDKRRQGTSSAT